MPRRYPDRRRRGKGRRPPHRYRGGPIPPRPAGFTGPGFRQLYDRLLTGVAGPEKRRYFNDISAGIVLVGGVCGVILGAACFGPLGAFLGLGAGIAAAGSFVESGRFFRSIRR